ncbi:MAG: glycosyltransferase [Tannerella sp.]|jgi:glycosyltransferase|nr:glycosyltransferase [Tannerella sp.]
MKNVYIIDEYASSKINGIGAYIRELIHCLQEMEVNICRVDCCHDTATFKIETRDGVRQMQFPAIPGFWGQHHAIIDKFLRLYINDSQDNIFLFHHTPCEFLVKTVKDSFPLSRLVFVIHDMTWTGDMLGDKTELERFAAVENRELFEKEYPELLPRFNEEKRMYEAVHRIVALTAETVDLLQNVYGTSDEKISFIPNGLRDICCEFSEKERNRLKSSLFVPLHEKVIVFAGRVKNVKGIYQVINGLKKAVKTEPDFRLVVAGTVFEMKKLMEHAGGIAAKITFTGQIPKDKLHEWYRIADIGVLASYWEQCSYTGIEMMMYGLPVVASDGFCVGDMFKNDENAKIARIGDRSHPEEFENNLTEAFLELLQSDELCRTLGENGRKVYESRYQINYMKEGYQMLFNSL